MTITATFTVFRHKCREVDLAPTIGVSLVIVILALVGATTFGV